MHKLIFFLIKVIIIPPLLVEGAVFGPFEHAVYGVKMINSMEQLDTDLSKQFKKFAAKEDY